MTVPVVADNIYEFAYAGLEARGGRPSGPRQCERGSYKGPPEPTGEARRRVVLRMQEIAALKNLRFTDEECWSLVAGTIRFCGVFGADGNLAAGDPEFMTRLDRGIDACMDTCAVERTIRVTAGWLAAETRFDFGVIALVQDEVLKRLRQDYQPGSFYRWPSGNPGMDEAFQEFGVPGASLALGLVGEAHRA